jgi:hypothetical protein
MITEKPTKKNKSQILKEKYGFDRNRERSTDFDESGQKENHENKVRSKEDYAYNSDKSKKKLQQY